MAPGGATVTPAAASRLGDQATVRRSAPEASRISSMPSTLRGAWDGTQTIRTRTHTGTGAHAHNNMEVASLCA
jgi:hypothetical protein